MVPKERVLEEAGRPVPFLMAVTLFVVGFSSSLLWDHLVVFWAKRSRQVPW